MAKGESVHEVMLDAWNRRDCETMRGLFHDAYTYVGGDGVELAGPDTASG